MVGHPGSTSKNSTAKTRTQGSINKQIQRYEFTAVYSHPDAKVDIVLVHGLNGDPQRSWTAKNGVFWPSDLLPESLKPQLANVLVYGYNGDVYSRRNDRSASENFVHHHAQTLVTTLTHYRMSEGSTRNPIIWVAHSLGGILTKRALLYSNDLQSEHQEEYRSIFVSTYAIIFLGTPHTGSDIASWGHVLQSMSDVVIPRRFFDSEPILIKTLKRDSETLQNINNHFLDIYQRFVIHMAHENHKTDIKGTKVIVVDSHSASPQLPGVTYYGIEATHSGICKFESINAPGYRTVSTAIREWVAEAPPVIQVRWLVESDDREVRSRMEFNERRLRHLGSVVTDQGQGDAKSVNETPFLPNSPALPAPEPIPLLPATSQSAESESQGKEQPPFVHPEPFRPNSFFVGRKEELECLHRMLMDSKRRAEGTSAVLIQCLPGGGKTHLARQYVFHHQEHYPGGIYWVRATSLQEMEYWYWRIAKTEALKKLVAKEDATELRDPRKIVAIVRTWLNSTEDWLLVLDGVHFDIPALHEFIPDAKNTSLIYTSTERAVAGDYQFDNPQVMELGLLTSQEAQDLLLLEMDKKRPWTQDDRARARELVQLMGRLPLMIHVAAQHLKATKEPISRYLRSYRNRPKAGSLPAYLVVRDQLQHRGAVAALNLISILVFFDQHVPVEMIILGLPALDNRTPVKTCDASHRKSSLSNTLAVLIAFALVERHNGGDISPTSSRTSKRSFDKDIESLDLLSIHSVVQAFFIDTLTEEKQVHFWLERAVMVWCYSFDHASRKIKGAPKVGLPDDYRWYAIHGQVMLHHLERFKKNSTEIFEQSKTHVEERLAKIKHEVDQLSHTVQTNIIDGSGEVPPISVFERTSSSSEMDSVTPPSHSSMDELGPSIEPSVSIEHLSQVPGHEPPYSQNPYHWHVPYPPWPDMPSTPRLVETLDDDIDTVVDLSSTPVANHTSPVIGEPTSFQSNHDQTHLTPPAQQAKPSVKPDGARKAEQQSYLDRVKAWRDSETSDPRVSISREVARGAIARTRAKKHRSLSLSPSRLTAESDAELELHRIKAAAPAQLQDEDVSEMVDMAALPKTRLLPQAKSHAEPSATASSASASRLSPIDFSSSLAKIAAAPSTWTAATLRRLRATLKSRGSVKPTARGNDEARGPDADVENTKAGPPTDSLFQGSRSANSSPGQYLSPFSPTTPPLAVKDRNTQSLHGHPAAIRHWASLTHPPDLDAFDPDDEQLSLSYPPPQRRDPAPTPARQVKSQGASPAPRLPFSSQTSDGLVADISSPEASPRGGAAMTNRQLRIRAAGPLPAGRYRLRESASLSPPMRSGISAGRRASVPGATRSGAVVSSDGSAASSPGGFALPDGRLVEFGEVEADGARMGLGIRGASGNG